MSSTQQPKILSIRSVHHSEDMQISMSDLPVHLYEVPLLCYDVHHIDFRRLSRYTTLIITSKYAAALISRKYLFDVECMVVGEASAAILSHNPHIQVKAVFNDVDELKSALATQEKDTCLYLAADVISKGLQSYSCYRALYSTLYRNILESHELEILNSKIDYVFLHSENSARQFIYICKRYDLLQNFHKPVVITISDKVQKVVEAYLPRVISAAKPSNAAMINILRAELCL